MYSNLKTSSLLKNSQLCFIAFLLLFSIGVSAAEKFNAQKRYLYVQPGQDVFSLVKVLYPKHKSRWPEIIKNIVRKNPHAFVGADASRIQAGSRIELPPVTSRMRPAASARAMVYKGPKAVGQVVKKRGKVFVLSPANKKRNLDIGSEVYVGDRVYTGVTGFIRMNMIDDAKIDLRCNSEMLIEAYQLIKGANRSVLHLLKGSVNKVTGSIGKFAEDVYEMHTPMATVGVRGTEYAIRVLQTYGCDGSLDVNSKGMFVKVRKGAIDLKNQKQKRLVSKGESIHLASKAGEIKSIQAQDGVFSAVESDKKSQLLGSVYWMLVLMPLVMLMRLPGRR